VIEASFVRRRKGINEAKKMEKSWRSPISVRAEVLNGDDIQVLRLL
jgi:hypothetical protein